MMQWIIASSLRLRVLVVAVALLLLGTGVWQLRNTSLDVVPEFSPLSLQVKTEALGLSAAEVESLITVPMEADLLNGVPWLKSIEFGVADRFVLDRDVLCAGYRHHARPADGPGASDPGACPAQRLQPAAAVAAGLLRKPDHERRPQFQVRAAGRYIGAGAVEHRAATDRRPGRCQRRHLGPAQPAGPGAGGPQAAA